MSNRAFWLISAAVSTVFAFTMLALPLQSNIICSLQGPTNQTFCSADADVDVEIPPGQSLEWYIQNWGKNKPIGGAELCFAKNTPPDVVAHLAQTVHEANSRYQLNTRWSGAQGTPRALTWSFVPDGLNIPSGNGEPAAPSVLFATLDAQFAGIGGRATWIARIQACFDRWQQLSGITYTRITFGGTDWDDGASMFNSAGAAGLRGDCRISMKNIDLGGNVLAYNFFPSGGGDMVLDSSEDWAAGNPGLQRFLRNVVSHEHGHGIGLSHVCPDNATKLMEPFVSVAYDGPRHDDIRAVQRHYGDVSGSNNTSATARVLGVLDVGSPIGLGTVTNPIGGTAPTNSSTLSIDGNGELDWYRFTLTGPKLVTVTVTPRGLTYDSSTQNGDGSCNSGNNINSLTQANLNVDLVDTNGVTVLATAAAQPAGGTETIAGFSISAAGNYYVRVSEGDAPTQSQLYTLNLSAAAPACTPVNVNPIAAASTVCGSAYASGLPTFSGTAPVTWSLSGSPPVGVTINPVNGQVSWPNPTTSPTPHLIQVTGTNACGNDTEILSLTVLVGDFNGDGVLNDLDIPQFSDHLLGLDVSRLCAADVNGDTFVDGLDLLAWVDLAQ